jgi:enamine deaminase RidA (YjgF/YER057c/UK114 family)
MVLPRLQVTPPAGSYVLARRVGNLIYTAGHLPIKPDGNGFITGKVGDGADLTTQQGYDAARAVAINMLATLKDELGDLDRVKSVVKVFGLVNCVDGFSQQPQVVNGFSETMFQVRA